VKSLSIGAAVTMDSTDVVQNGHRVRWGGRALRYEYAWGRFAE